MPAFFTRQLEGVATYWRLFRRDGMALAFTSHNQALYFGGLLHRAAPGMVPSSIKRTAGFGVDSAEVSGALSHDSISESELDAGLFDGASIEIGAVDWETLSNAAFYHGSLGRIDRGTRGFTAELVSAKSALDKDLVPRTSPTCRAEFCGPGCNLSVARFTHRATVTSIDVETNSVFCEVVDAHRFVAGALRFLGGSQAGETFGILAHSDGRFTLDRPIDAGVQAGTAVNLIEGCDGRVETCLTRFDNVVNFRGEPFLPGNDAISRYAKPK